MSLARLSDLAIGQGVDRPVDAALQVAGDVEIVVPLKGLVNVVEEKKRLLREIAKIDKEIGFLDGKLANPFRGYEPEGGIGFPCSRVSGFGLPDVHGVGYGIPGGGR